MRSIPAVSMFGFALLSLLAVPAPAQTDVVGLRGRVVDGQNAPVAGAWVVIASATPTQGPSLLGKRAYPDCGRLERTDADGRFQFQDTSPGFDFELAIAAGGFEGTQVAWRPEADGEFDVTIHPIPADQTQSILGRVVDAAGQPIPGAIVTPRHITYGRTTTGSNKGLVTKLAIADDTGEFELFAKSEISELRIRAAVANQALAEEQFVFATDKAAEIAVGKGASIRGRLVFQGQPVAGIKLGLVQEDRGMRSITTPLEIATDAEGIFSFDHLPPDREYTIYTLLQQDAQCVLPVSLVSAPMDGKRAELGDVAASPPHRLVLRIRTADKQPLPENSVVYVSRSRAWQAGRFKPAGQVDPELEILDAPAELYEITVRIPGYTVLRTAPIRSPDINRRYRIAVEGDTTIAFLLVKSE